MATISMEIGGRSKKRVYFLVRAGSTKKRIPTTIFLTSSEISRNGKRITNERKARAAELIRRKLDDALIDLAPQLFGQEEDASYIAKRLVDNTEVLDFFKFADDWVEHSTLKGVRNYKTFLNSLENYVGQRVLPFRDITFSFLTGGFNIAADADNGAITEYLSKVANNVKVNTLPKKEKSFATPSVGNVNPEEVSALADKLLKY